MIYLSFKSFIKQTICNFFLFCICKLNIFQFWTVSQKIKQFEDVTFGSWKK